jgi:hypothetical protein
MTGLEPTGADRQPDGLALTPISPVTRREAYALLTFPLALLAVLLVLAVTLGVPPPG